MKITTKKFPKVSNRGETMIFVEIHDDPTTKRVWNTRDVVFHYRMYYNSERNEIDNNLYSEIEIADS